MPLMCKTETSQVLMIQSTTSCVKYGGGSVATRSHVADNAMGRSVFIDDVTADRSIRMNSEVYRAILCSHSVKCFKTERKALCNTDGKWP